MSEHPIDFGRYLQNRRQKQGISLALISQKTKISMGCLRQIENEDWDNLPAPTFVKGFIRSYAAEVGADIEDALRRYEAGRLMRLQLAQDQTPKMQSAYRFWGHMGLVVFLLAALFGTTIFLSRQMDRPAAPLAQEDGAPVSDMPLVTAGTDEDSGAPPQPPVAIPQSEPKPSPELRPLGVEKPIEATAPAAVPGAPVPQAAETVPAFVPFTDATSENVETPQTPMEPVPREPMVLEITAVETTWLRVAADQGPHREMTLRQGDEVTVRAESGFHLHIGNAGGLRLSLNGQPIPLLGRSGQVVTLQLP